MATFGNILRMESNCMEGPPTCAHHASIFDSYMSWNTLPNNILVKLSTKYSTSQSSPHITLWTCPSNMLRPQSCLVLFGHLLRVIWIFDIVVKKKQLWGHPTTHFLHVDEIMFPSKCIPKWSHLLHMFDFAPITHANVHNIWFVYCKM